MKAEFKHKHVVEGTTLAMGIAAALVEKGVQFNFRLADEETNAYEFSFEYAVELGIVGELQ